MIDRERWQAISAHLDEALALKPEQRDAWLADLQERDPALAEQVRSMLQGAPSTTEMGHATTLPGLDAFGRHLDAALQPELPSDRTPQAGQRWGAWMLLHKIGEGGMGQVWLAARDDGLYQAQAAIKLLRSDLTAERLQARFARERAVLGRLNHANVARLLDAGVANGQAYLVLEHVPGRILDEHVRSACPQLSQRVQLLLRIARAVEHAHAQLIVHRDLKPSNVIVTPEGEPKLLDFGIAGLLDDGEGVDSDLTRQTGRGLTLGYAAPEQILGGPIGTAADVFSLGVMLFELISGDLPFAPRSAGRLAAEHAVLHGEPRRLWTVLSEDKGGARGERQSQAPTNNVAAQGVATQGVAAHAGPGPAQDARRAHGDLEAIVAKALRKQPAERYATVGAFIDDLQRWLTHRPVSARRDEWRHQTALFLRRHAGLAAATAVVVLSLSAGLAVSTWQWQRAQTAARQSDRIAEYLVDLLKSASPDRHGGQWPTVLQLLDSSRAALPKSFQDDPETRLRLLAVLAETYHELNRFDVAMPLNEELVRVATERHGAGDPMVLQARFRQARTQQVQGLFDKAIAALEPMQAEFERAFGAQSEELRRLLYVLSTSYARAGRLMDADRMLTQAGELTQAAFGTSSPQWMAHQNHLQVLRVGQGRLREALAAMKTTEPFWSSTSLEHVREILVYRRNTIAVQVRVGDYEGIEARARTLLADMDRLLGPGNDMATGLRHELARYFTEVGQSQRALEQRLDNLARAQAAQVHHPAVLLPLQVHALLARAQAHAADAAELVRDARQLLTSLRTHADKVGYARADAWINLMRVGLALDNADLAAEALAPLKADTGLRLDRDVLLASRVAQMEGELARLQGDLPKSRELLVQRMKVFDRPGERRVLPGWVAGLDLAYTLVLMGDPGAAAALQSAQERRPMGAPAGHPLDAAAAYLAARLQASAGAPSASASDTVRAAEQALVRAQARRPGQPAGVGLGSFGGALI